MIHEIIVGLVILFTEIVAKARNTDVDSSTQDTGNQHDDTIGNCIVGNIVLIRSLGDKHSI